MEQEGLVEIYESRDGGSGKTEETSWSFRVFDGVDVVNSNNPLIAATVQLALETSSPVRLIYDESKTVSLARIDKNSPTIPKPFLKRKS